MIPFYRTPVLDISIPPSPQLMATVGPNRPTRQLQVVATFPSSPNPQKTFVPYLRRRASRSDSRRTKMSSSRTARHTKQISSCAGRANRGASGHTRALDVPDDGTGGVVHELDAHLGDATTRTCCWTRKSASARGGASGPSSRGSGPTGSAEDTGDLDELDGGLGGIHFRD